MWIIRKIRRPVRILSVALLSFLCLLPACERDNPDHASITGKVVYRDMGIEEMPIRALRWNGDRWEEYALGRSTYHGAFVFRMLPGTYRLVARGAIPAGRKEIPLTGETDRIEVLPGTRRIDRVLIELAPIRNGEPGTWQESVRRPGSP